MSEISKIKPDAELLEALKKGQPDAYKKIYTNYYNMVFGLVTRNSGHPEDAEDVFQEALIVLIKNIRKPNFSLTAKLGTYLHSIVYNIWMTKLRKKGKMGVTMEIEEEVIDLSEDTLEEKKTIEKKYDLIKIALEQMGDDCKKIIVDYYYKKIKLKDIGVALGYTDGFVKVKKNRCMNAFKKLIYKHPDYSKFYT